MTKQIAAQLILRDGTTYEGYSFGAKRSTTGEVVFSTGMVGYPESFTDPSFHGQILVATYPMIGNYGVPRSGFESERVHIQGLVVQDYTEHYSHATAVESLGAWLGRNKVPAIFGIDTRAITKKLRAHGVMLGQIVVGNEKPFQNIDDPNTRNLVAEVSIAKPKLYRAAKEKKRVLAVDCGMKENIIRCFRKRNVTVKRVPWDYNYLDELEKDFDGLFVANGPGDPAMLPQTTEILRSAFALRKPIFGICLGCQLMGLAAGAQTYKLKYGHRSQNQPCHVLRTNRVYLTTQNHGYAIDATTLPVDWTVWLRNANDNTIEGIRHKKLPFFSVQFHPEANPGPQDTEFLFDAFIDCMK